MMEFDASEFTERENMLAEDIEGLKQELIRYEKLAVEQMDQVTQTELACLKDEIQTQNKRIDQLY